MRCRLILSCLLCSWLSGETEVCVLRASEGAVPWKIGFAQAKITPELSVVMAGYAGRTKPSSGLFGDLYVKAMSLEDGDGNRSLLITADSIGFRKPIANAILEAIGDASGLGRSDILLNSSHTHTGPSQATNARVSVLGKGEAKVLLEYTKTLKAKVVETALRAFESPELSRLSYATGTIDFVMNRREPTSDGIKLGVNPRGPVDRSVPLLKIEGLDGRLRGVLFGAACHNTTLTGRHRQICGDFAGFAQASLEDAYPGIQAMFMQGCGGDANPHPRGTLMHSMRHGDELAAEVSSLLARRSSFRRVEGPLRTAYALVALPLEAAPDAEEIEAMAHSRSAWERNAAKSLLSGEGETHYNAPFSVWQFGSDLTLVGLSGEVVYDYVLLCERVMGPENLWISGYNNDVFGYLPSARILEEGGYEARGLYSGRRFDPKVETVVGQGLEDLARLARNERFDDD